MSLAIIYSRASSGIDAPLVTVETHLSNGLPKFNIVGLPEAAVKESKDRVRSAILQSQFEFPIRHITVNLAPADLPKEGGRFDLPIALGILAASGQIPHNTLTQYEFTGELALSGELRPVKGILPVALAAYRAQRHLVIAEQNSVEATLVNQALIYPATHLLEVCAHLQGVRLLTPLEIPPRAIVSAPSLNLSDIMGQSQGKRALEIAAAGGHSLLLTGPPGTGKTMLASRLTSILPTLSETEALEVAAIASISSAGFQAEQWGRLPFRAPHHTISSVALVGGGRPPKPGEVSLSHRGVLFLDELPEFNRHTLECLREPMESGFITISRAAVQTTFPAHFQLIAAMNPCPCGYAGHAVESCECSPEQIKRYIGKISGPLLDRIDIQILMPSVAPHLLNQKQSPQNESSEFIQARVLKARARQLERQGKVNALLTPAELSMFAHLNAGAMQLLNQAATKFNLSARAHHRIIKLARTIADLTPTADIHDGLIAQALELRYLDRIKRANASW